MALYSLTDLNAARLDLEHQWWPTAGREEDAIRDLLGMTPTRYYQRLNRLANTELRLHTTRRWSTVSLVFASELKDQILTRS